MQTPVVKVQHLSHRYNVQWAVKDLSFEVNGSGIYGLLGANGAGKSTTMNIMCGALIPTRGEVFVGGVDMLKNPGEAKKKIGFLPQKPPLYTELTVQEFLDHCARVRLMEPKKIKAAVAEVMEKCQLTHFRNRLISNLSGGYQQRVGIAQAVIHRPEFVVLDEPTNGLDPNQILEIRSLIREIAEERTVILSTHILQEVQVMCQYIWMINDGMMAFSGTMDEFDSHVMPNSLLISMINPPSVHELMDFEGVQQVEMLNDRKFRIHYSDAQQVTDLLITKSVHEQWHISELVHEKNSLENIFSVLSGKKLV